MAFKFFKKIKVESKNLISYLALLISIGTFFLLVYEINLTRKQQYTSVLPYLEIQNRSPSGDEYAFVVVNNGIGPAFIKEVNVDYNGKIYKGDLYDFFEGYISKNDTIDVNYLYSSALNTGRLIPAGKYVTLLGISGSEKDANQLKNWLTNDNLDVSIVFSSVYGETWIVNKNDGVRKL